MLPTLQLQLFGDFQLRFQGQVVTTLRNAREQSLLAYLVLHAAAPQSRHHLAFLFWPDTGEAQALTNLRNLLFKVRHALPDADHLLWADSQMVQWRPQIPCAIDVIDFEATAQAATSIALEDAVRLYGGDLLPHCYDEWITPYRLRLRQQAMSVLARLIDLLEEARAYQAAIGYGQQLQQLDPLEEESYRRLMRLHAAAGDRAGAIRHYQKCVAILDEELDVTPSPATRELYLRLLATSIATPSQNSTPREQLPLVGRQAEWKMLLDAWFAAASGVPSCVVLAGEAGIGKTRLAEEVITWVSQQGYRVAVAHSYAAEGALAYAPVVAWLRSAPWAEHLKSLEQLWLSEVARLLPELLVEASTLPAPRPMTEGWQRQHLFEALARAILSVGEPLLLFLDDLQWSDRDTLEWLHYLLRNRHAQGGPRLLLLGTVRNEEVTSTHPLLALLEGLRRSSQVTQIDVGALSEAETKELARNVAEQALTSDQATQLYAETEGNPLFVVEAVRARQTQGISLEMNFHLPSSAEVTSRLPQKVQMVIDARLAHLTSNAREAAGLAAAIGRAFTFDVLAQASNQGEETLVQSLEELWQRRIIRERGAEAYDFSHDKLREVTYLTLSAARRRLLHRRIAEAMIALYGDRVEALSGQLATHYELSGHAELAVPYYQLAAEVARRLYANAEAIHFYSRAVALLSASPSPSQELSVSLHEALGDLLHLTGQHEQAETAFRHALEQGQADDLIRRARLNRKGGRCAVAMRRFELAAAAFDMAISVLGPPPQPPDEAWWQEWFAVRLAQVMLYYWQSRPDQMLALIEESRPHFEKHAKANHWVGFYQALTSHGMKRDRYLLTDETMGYVRAWIDAQQLVDSPGELAYALFNDGFCWLWHDNLDKAGEQLEKSLKLARQVGDIMTETRCLTYLTVLYRKLGALDQVQHFIAQSFAVAATAGMVEYTALAHANQAWSAWQQGDPSAAASSAQAAKEIWQRLKGHASASFQWTARWPLIAMAVDEGQLAAAVEECQRLLDPDQLRIPPPMDQMLEEIIEASERGDDQRLASLLQEALHLAKQMRYL